MYLYCPWLSVHWRCRWGWGSVLWWAGRRLGVVDHRPRWATTTATTTTSTATTTAAASSSSFLFLLLLVSCQRILGKGGLERLANYLTKLTGLCVLHVCVWMYYRYTCRYMYTQGIYMYVHYCRHTCMCTCRYVVYTVHTRTCMY